MDPRTVSSNLKPGDVKAFNTRDILIYLFKESVTDQKFTNDGAAPLAALDSQIARLHNVIEGYMSEGPQHQIETIKTLLGAAKDSSKRKELIQTTVEMDAKLASLHAQGKGLEEQSRKIISQFWDLVVKSNIGNTPVSRESIERIKQQLDDLSKRTEPFKQDEDTVLGKIKETTLEVAKMTGRPVETIMEGTQVLPKSAPAA